MRFCHRWPAGGIFAVAIFLACVAVSPVMAEEQSVSLTALDQRFQAILQATNAEDYQTAFNQTEELQQLAERNGVTNLLAYSLRLVDEAKFLASNPRSASLHQKIEFLLARAFELSPEEPVPYLESVTLWNQIGVEEAVGLLGQGLSRLVYSARTMVLSGITIWFLLLSATSLALLFCCVVRLIVNLKRLIYALSQALPARSRAVGSMAAVLIVLFVPLAGGPLLALAVWSLVLSRYLREGKWFAVMAGAMILSWAMTLITFERVSMHAASPRLQAMDRVLRGSYSPRDREILEQAVEEWSFDPLVMLARGELAILEGDVANADTYLSRVLTIGQQVALPATVQRRAMFSLGALRYQQGVFDAAERFFSEVEQSDRSFPVMYNLALTKLARVDTVGHQEYYAKAKSLDWARLQQLENASLTANAPIFIWQLPTPSTLLLRELFQPVPESLKRDAAKAENMRRVVESHLLFWRWDIGPISGAIAILGCLTFGWGYLLMIGREPRRVFLEKTNTGRSAIWALVPMGPFLLRAKPGTGLALLTLFLACFMTGVSEPSLLPDSGTWSEAIRHLALLSAIVLFVSSIAFGMLHGKEVA